MTKKQTGLKTSGKSVNSAGASSKQLTTLIAEITDQKTHLWEMNVLSERGYNMAKASQSFLSNVEGLKWELFVQPRSYFVEPVVKEFYAGIQEVKGDSGIPYSIVRGRKVLFEYKRINDQYLLTFEGDEFERRCEKVGKMEMERVKSRIAIEGSEWLKFTSTEFTLNSRDIIPELGNWHLFITSSIMPTSHTTTLNKEKLLLLDAICTEGNVDIGRIISDKILDSADKNSGYLFFPCLITELCRKQGVKIEQHELLQRKYPQGPLSAEFKGRKFVQPLPAPAKQEHLMQKLHAVWKFEQEQHEWIKLRLKEISEKESQFETPNFPDWVFEGEEKEEEEREKVSKNKKKVVSKKDVKGKRKREEEQTNLRSQRNLKGKQKVGEEEEIPISEEQTEEDEVLKRVVKEMEKNEEEEETETDDSSAKSTGGDVIMDSEPIPEDTENADASMKETTPIQIPAENPPQHTTSDLILTPSNFELEKEISLQVIEENIPGEEEQTSSEEKNKGGPEQPIDAPASDAGASVSTEQPTVVKTVFPANIDETLNLVTTEIAKKKKEYLGTTSKIFKRTVQVEFPVKETPKATESGSVGGGKESTNKPTEKGKEATKEPVKEVQHAEKEPEKETAAVQSDAAASDATAMQNLAETTTNVEIPKARAATALKQQATKEKKHKIKQPAVRSSSRLKSGAKKE